MSDPKPSQLQIWMTIASKALPYLPLGPFGALAGDLAALGVDALEQRAIVQAAQGTAEQLAYLDKQNEVSVIDKIREQGKTI